ncbi:MAG: CSLREA domain-containing protein [Anaerolinea sp.]|nr:CSLREA domain-containing protein [Anaerolinea sp.]
MTKHLWFIGVLALCSVVATISPVNALGINVTTTDDEDNTDLAECSLREAIQAADTDAAYGGCTAGSGTDTISLPAGTYQLTLGTHLQIDSQVTISGAGAASTFIQAGSAENSVSHRVFFVDSDGWGTFSGVTIRYGGIWNSASVTFGGGILNNGITVLTNGTQVRDNGAWGGGGITMQGTTAQLSIEAGTSVESNTSSSIGGGIYMRNGTILMAGALNENRANGNSGGGMYQEAGSGTLTGTVSGNTIGNNFGGGLYLSTNGIAISGATITANTADASGGGIEFLNGGSIENSTISDNSAGSGAAIWLDHGTLTITNTTIRDNHSVAGSGAIYNAFGGTVTITGSRLLFNTGTLATGNAYFSNAVTNSDSITDSCIVGHNPTAIRDAGGAAFVATNNWWGVAAGPGPVGPSTGGDTITTNVTFTGWKTSAPTGCPVCIEPSGVGNGRICS